jgi:diaminopimelate decarboxylase
MSNIVSFSGTKAVLYTHVHRVLYRPVATSQSESTASGVDMSVLKHAIAVTSEHKFLRMIHIQCLPSGHAEILLSNDSKQDIDDSLFACAATDEFNNLSITITPKPNALFWFNASDFASETHRMLLSDYFKSDASVQCGVVHYSTLQDGSFVVLSSQEAVTQTVLQTLLCSDESEAATAASQAATVTVTVDSKVNEQDEAMQQQLKWWWEAPDMRTKLLELADTSKPVVSVTIGSDGKTPCIASTAPVYAYSLDVLRKYTSSLKSMSNVDRVFFAIKANSHPDVLRAVHEAGLNFECVSPQELDLLFSLFPDIDPDRILFTPNFAPRGEYEYAIKRGVHLTLDNVWVVNQWADLLSGQRIIIRVDPGKGKGHHAHTQTGGARSKFGVSVDQLLRAKTDLDRHNITVCGLHIHAGSGIHETDNWLDNAQLLSSLTSTFTGVEFINVGGGYGIRYKPSDTPVDVAKVNTHLMPIRQAFPHVQLWTEPGRYVVGDCGVLLARVTQLKSKPGRNFVGVTTGMNMLMRPALYGSYHHIVNLTRLEDHSQQDKLHDVDVVGPICETGDVLGHSRAFPTGTQEGDVVLIASAGAYGKTMSSVYNMRQQAVEIAF